MSVTQIQHFKHKHPLSFFDNNINNVVEAYCFNCREQIPGRQISELDIEKLGAQFPKEIQHPLHPHRLDLELEVNPVSTACNACGFSHFGIFYTCFDCDFALDINCIPLTPTKDQLVRHHQSFNELGQTHSLIRCHSNTNKFYRSCSACNIPFDDDDEIYTCLECHTLLHESCIDQLALEIEHPFHPQHPLTLLPTYRSSTKYSFCKVCDASLYGCTYRCVWENRGCNFSIHAACASSKPTIWSQLHEHLLGFVKMIRHDDLLCNVCGNNSTEFLRCVDCDYSLHLRCNPNLPKTIKIEEHLHDLTLTDSPVKDYPDQDEDTKFVCDACEETRYLHHPTYYCKEGDFVAHVDCHCLISQVLRALEEEWLADVLIDNINEEIAELHIQTEAESRDVEALMSKLKALEGKREQILDSMCEQMSSSGNEDSDNNRVVKRVSRRVPRRRAPRLQARRNTPRRAPKLQARRGVHPALRLVPRRQITLKFLVRLMPLIRSGDKDSDNENWSNSRNEDLENEYSDTNDSSSKD